MMKLETRLKSYWSKVEKRGLDECWLWTGCRNRKGYGCIGWNKKQQGVHRVSWLLAYGPVPEGLHVLHRCDNPSCQNPNHLFLGTNEQNIADKVAKGRHRGARGERSGSAKLTERQVKAIRLFARYKLRSQSNLAIRYGVSKKHIQAIVYRKTWKHI